MDAKDLRTESTLGARSHDGSNKYSQSATAITCNRNKSYHEVGSNSLGKVEVPSSRPCAVIGPDRVVPPTAAADAFPKKPPPDQWLCTDTLYRRPPDYPTKMTDYQNQTRNISPRQTFQENMQRIMVPPSYNSIKMMNDSNLPGDGNLVPIPKSNKMNIATDVTKYCDVPYNISPLPTEQKNFRDVNVPSANSTINQSGPYGWPTSNTIRPSRSYGASELYQYPDYPSTAATRAVPVGRPLRNYLEETAPAYPERFYPDNMRFKPYPSVKEGYPQPRYECINNYPNAYHPPPYPPPRYDLQKSHNPHVYSAYSQVKYFENRMGETGIDGYQRPNPQPSYNVSYPNQFIHSAYGSVSGNCLQNKLLPYPPDMPLKGNPLNKLAYENKMFSDFDNARNKSYVVPENYYGPKGQVMISKPHSANIPPASGHPYYRKEFSPFRNYDPSKYPEIATNVGSTTLRFPSQFSPNMTGMPPDSNSRIDAIQAHGLLLDDNHYVGNPSIPNLRVAEPTFNRLYPDLYARHGYKLGPMRRSSSNRTETNNSSSANSKEKKNIDVRQFLQQWNEDDDNNDSNNAKQVAVQNSVKSKMNAEQEQLYVLGLVNVPSEELDKYDHIQKISKLPDNIKGYNSLELLNQFEEAIESSNYNNKQITNPRELQGNFKSVPIQRATVPPLPRPISPLDVESKISQSVIHKEVGCNFEIKPCSPKMMNVEFASPVQTVLSKERVIEKLSNPLCASTTTTIGNVSFKSNEEGHSAINTNNPSCKMEQNQFSSRNFTAPAKSNYSLTDLESSSGVCLASLPRLDNEIEFNFPEVNQQFINANTKTDTVITNTHSENQTEIIERKESIFVSEPINKKLEPSEFSNLDPTLKLCRFRRSKKEDCDLNSDLINTERAVRTDSVIIKNPDTAKELDSKDNDTATFLPNIDSQNKDTRVMSLHSSELNITEKAFPLHTILDEEEKDSNIALDFSVNKYEYSFSDEASSKLQADLFTNPTGMNSSTSESQINKEQTTETKNVSLDSAKTKCDKTPKVDDPTFLMESSDLEPDHINVNRNMSVDVNLPSNNVCDEGSSDDSNIKYFNNDSKIIENHKEEKCKEELSATVSAKNTNEGNVVSLNEYQKHDLRYKMEENKIQENAWDLSENPSENADVRVAKISNNPLTNSFTEESQDFTEITKTEKDDGPCCLFLATQDISDIDKSKPTIEGKYSNEPSLETAEIADKTDKNDSSDVIDSETENKYDEQEASGSVEFIKEDEIGPEKDIAGTCLETLKAQDEFKNCKKINASTELESPNECDNCSSLKNIEDTQACSESAKDNSSIVPYFTPTQIQEDCRKIENEKQPDKNETCNSPFSKAYGVSVDIQRCSEIKKDNRKSKEITSISTCLEIQKQHVPSENNIKLSKTEELDKLNTCSEPNILLTFLGSIDRLKKTEVDNKSAETLPCAADCLENEKGENAAKLNENNSTETKLAQVPREPSEPNDNEADVCKNITCLVPDNIPKGCKIENCNVDATKEDINEFNKCSNIYSDSEVAEDLPIQEKKKIDSEYADIVDCSSTKEDLDHYQKNDYLTSSNNLQQLDQSDSCSISFETEIYRVSPNPFDLFKKTKNNSETTYHTNYLPNGEDQNISINNVKCNIGSLAQLDEYKSCSSISSESELTQESPEIDHCFDNTERLELTDSYESLDESIKEKHSISDNYDLILNDEHYIEIDFGHDHGHNQTQTQKQITKIEDISEITGICFETLSLEVFGKPPDNIDMSLKKRNECNEFYLENKKSSKRNNLEEYSAIQSSVNSEKPADISNLNKKTVQPDDQDLKIQLKTLDGKSNSSNIYKDYENHLEPQNSEDKETDEKVHNSKMYNQDASTDSTKTKDVLNQTENYECVNVTNSRIKHIVFENKGDIVKKYETTSKNMYTNSLQSHSNCSYENTDVRRYHSNHIANHKPDNKTIFTARLISPRLRNLSLFETGTCTTLHKTQNDAKNNDHMDSYQTDTFLAETLCQLTCEEKNSKCLDSLNSRSAELENNKELMHDSLSDILSVFNVPSLKDIATTLIKKLFPRFEFNSNSSITQGPNDTLDARNILVHSVTNQGETLNLKLMQQSSYNNQNRDKRSRFLKRSLSDSDLNNYDNPESSMKRKKYNQNKELQTEYVAENIFLHNRRNSISTFFNEDDVSFCILIDDNCIITEECEDFERTSAADETECFEYVENEYEIQENSGNANIACLEHLDESEYSEDRVLHSFDESPNEETWIDDVACVETVVCDNVAEDVEVSSESSPRLSDYDSNSEDTIPINNNFNDHTDKVRHIYEGCHDNNRLVETLFRTPQMNVNKTLINEYPDTDRTKYIDQERADLENMLSESMTTKFSNVTTLARDSLIMARNLAPQESTLSEEILIREGTHDINKEDSQDLDSKLMEVETESNIQTQYGIVHSCESSFDNVFSYNKLNENNTQYSSSSSSPEVSSTTSEEKCSSILLKITSYNGSIVSEISNSREVKRISCKYTEKNDYNSGSRSSNRPLITKAAQKYIPPISETIQDLKVKLPLPQQSLVKLQQLKLSKERPKLESNINNRSLPLRPDIPKKPKPKFEDVLKSIDDLQFKLHKEKNKKVKKCIPKVVIKKNGNGSHYTSSSSGKSFDPDLTGRKWQPWVFLEKNGFIDKMASTNRTEAIYNHRKRQYVFRDRFRKYKSISSAKFVITQPKLDEKGHLKYTIKLKQNY